MGRIKRVFYFHFFKTFTNLQSSSSSNKQHWGGNIVDLVHVLKVGTGKVPGSRIKDKVNVGINPVNHENHVIGRVGWLELDVEFEIGLFVEARAVVLHGHDALAVRSVDKGHVNVRKGRVFARACNQLVGEFAQVLLDVERRLHHFVKQRLGVELVFVEGAQVRLLVAEPFPVKGQIDGLNVVRDKDGLLGVVGKLVGGAGYRLVEAEDEQRLR